MLIAQETWLASFQHKKEVNFGSTDDPVLERPASFILATLVAPQFHSFVPIS